MATRYHLCLDVRGAIHNCSWQRELVGACTNDDGSKMTAREILDYLLDCVADGKQVIPCAPCDNFDFEKGCRGHAIESP